MLMIDKHHSCDTSIEIIFWEELKVDSGIVDAYAFVFNHGNTGKSVNEFFSSLLCILFPHV